METINEEKSADQEWQWCLVGNIVREHEHGETHELKSGTRQFRPGAKVFIYVENFRLQKVFKPAVLNGWTNPHGTGGKYRFNSRRTDQDS